MYVYILNPNPLNPLNMERFVVCTTYGDYISIYFE